MPKKGCSTLKIQPVLDKKAYKLMSACVFDLIPPRAQGVQQTVQPGTLQPSSVKYLSAIRKLKQCLFLTAVKVPVKMKLGPSEVFLN